MPPQDQPYGMGPLTYSDYLRVPDLLSLQHPQSDPPHHDEMLFIVIHQAYELWFKLVLHEMETAILHMRAGRVLEARHFVQRIVEVTKLLTQQIHLLETMKPVDFLQFRDRLKPASGFQSVQFREIEFLAGQKDAGFLRYFKDRPEMAAQLERRARETDLPTAYYELLAGQGLNVPRGKTARELEADPKSRELLLQALLPIYQRPADHLPLYLLTESLMEFDETFALWREHHVHVVERIIGGKPGTGGSAGVPYLRTTTDKRFFPLLWEVRTHLEAPP